MENKRKQWQELGKLTKPKKSLDLSFWRFIILVNWSWRGWDSLLHNGTLHWHLFSLHSFSKINANGGIDKGYGLVFIFLVLSIGYVKK